MLYDMLTTPLASAAVTTALLKTQFNTGCAYLSADFLSIDLAQRSRSVLSQTWPHLNFQGNRSCAPVSSRGFSEAHREHAHPSVASAGCRMPHRGKKATSSFPPKTAAGTLVAHEFVRCCTLFAAGADYFMAVNTTGTHVLLLSNMSMIGP